MTRTLYTCLALALVCAACGDDDDTDDVVIVPDDAPQTDRVVERSDIVSDQSGATMQDPNLKNAWGLAFNPIGTAWVSATDTGLSPVYDASGAQRIPPVAIPAAAGSSDPGSPTGQVFNSDSGSFEGDTFIFVSEDGVISGWQGDFGANAMMRIDNSGDGAVYKGVAVAEASDGWRLYAADFHNGVIGVYDANYSPISTEGDFTDPDLPDGYAPFNIEVVDDSLLVAYALQDEDAEDDVPGAGNGFIDRFDLDGNLTARVLSGAELNAPWGMVITPDSFSAAPNRLLVGNFGDGLIHAYSMDTTDLGATATLEGTLVDTSGADIAIDGLWALEFGPDAGGFTSDTLYFTAGPNDEEDGVFGRLASSATTDDGGNDGTAGTTPPRY